MYNGFGMCLSSGTQGFMTLGVNYGSNGNFVWTSILQALYYTSKNMNIVK